MNQTYYAPEYLYAITQFLLVIVLATFSIMTKINWSKAHIVAEEYDVYMSRFKKNIYAIIAILSLSAFLTLVRIYFKG